MADEAEQEDLEALIGSAGWSRVCTLAEQEWVQRERLGLTAALNDREATFALDKLRQIHAAKEAVTWFINLPRERLGILQRLTAHGDALPSRRGTL